MIKKKNLPLFRGLTVAVMSVGVLLSTGYGIADQWRASVDGALGTESYHIETSNPKYKSTYTKAADMMNELKAVSVQEGREGTAILKNENGVLPLTAKKANLWGGASYNIYRGMNPGGNSDQVDLPGALKAQGIEIDPTLQEVYSNFGKVFTEIAGQWGQKTRNYTYGPNQSAPAYDAFQIKEANPNLFTTEDGKAPADWKSKLTGDVNIITFCRPGGEGNTYKPGATKDTFGNVLNQNPFALSPDEIAVVDAAKSTGKKVVVLLNTSCQMEIGPLVKGEHAVDGIAYIGLPNDYQLTGVAEVLTGKVNATGALADTYAYSSVSSPSMASERTFGGEAFIDYADYGSGANYSDPRFPNGVSNELNASSFENRGTYNGGYYYIEAEGIYTGYNYYESRYFDAMKGTGNANSAVGSTDGKAWNYDNEVAYTFGYGLSYLDYSETLKSVDVDKSYNGEVTATITVKNESNKDGMFRTELYVSSPYTQYDKDNKIEKSAIQFLNSAKVELKAGETKDVQVKVDTKYLASFDAKGAGTYILDGGDYYFSLGNGAHEAVNNVLAAQGVTSVKGQSSQVKKVTIGTPGTIDKTTFSKNANGVEIKSQLEKVDLNYYLPGKYTYLSRSDWEGTYPSDKTLPAAKVADSPKKDQWVKEIRNQQYTIATNDPVKNFDGVKKNLGWTDVPASAILNVDDPFWTDYVNEIPAEEALGAIAHGGSQADTLSNIENPIVKQYDGPAGFNGLTLANNNGEEGKDPYYVDKNTEEGKFKDNIHSQTLAGSSFNPELALRWGRALGNFGLWASAYNVWAGGLNVHRNPYNGRNIEYLSEDEMLTNIWGREFIKGTREFGLIVGPKHLGFNDQEYNRAGTAVFMSEQKARETDLRGFQGAIEDGDAIGYMCAFNRMGSTNVSHFVELHKNVIRGEWGFKGLITTDMMSNNYYFNPESCAMATITQMADFAANNSHLNLGKDGKDATWSYLSPDAIKNDNKLVEASRLAMKYQLFAFANSAVMNISTVKVTPWWETALVTGQYVAYILAAGLAVLAVLCAVKED